MSLVSAKLKCKACEAETTSPRMKKPTRMQSSFTRLNCAGCGSRYLVALTKNSDGIRIHIDPIEVSERAKLLIMEKKGLVKKASA